MRLTSLFAILIGLSSAIFAADETAAPPLSEGGSDVHPDDVRRDVFQLQAEQFADRQSAEQRLLALGRPAIPVLDSSALDGDADLTARIIALLEQMFVAAESDIADDAERALERLAVSESLEASRRARAVLVGNQQLREQRAVAAIRRLGGKVDYVPAEDALQVNPFWPWRRAGEEVIDIPGQPPAKIRVWLLEDWQGGEDGLWHVARLEDNWGARLWGIEVTTVRGNGLTHEAVQTLAARLPNARILERGGSLGIQCYQLEPCQVMDLLPEGAAERAGLMPGDIITQLDDQPLTNFNDLVGQLLLRAPDEDVTLRIDRYGELFEIRVTLGSWGELETGSATPPPYQSPRSSPDDAPLFPLPEFIPER